MASLSANGVNGHRHISDPTARFSDIPKAISVAVAEADEALDVEISLDDEIQDDPTELCTLLENVGAANNIWIVVALGYAKHKKVDVGIEVLGKALNALSRNNLNDRLPILNALCWLNLLKCREAPRLKSGMCYYPQRDTFATANPSQITNLAPT